MPLSTLPRKAAIAGAASGTRTRDLFVTNEMLYRLSYCGWCDTSLCVDVLLLRLQSYNKKIEYCQ